MKPLVVLDRDGVINHDSPHYIRSPEEWRLIDGADEAIALLCRAGFDVVVATNQAGVAKGVFTLDALDAIHAKMTQNLARAGAVLKHIYFCPHHPDDRCLCRKPAPGMLIRACQDAGVDPAQVVFVGDSVRDIQAAMEAGCRAALVLTGNGLKTREQIAEFPWHASVMVFSTLGEFADAWISAYADARVREL